MRKCFWPNYYVIFQEPETENEPDNGHVDISVDSLYIKSDVRNFDDEDSENDFIEYDENNRILEEQQCIDTDGRIYTRKVIKINKFWVDNSESIPPITEKYTIDGNGKIRKIEDDLEGLAKDSTFIIHQCPNCYLQFPLLDHYKKHICNPSNTKNKFKCIHCAKFFSTFESLNTHIKTHLKFEESSGEMKRVITMEPFKCEICNTIFPSYRSLRLHHRMHEPVKDKAVDPPVSYSISGPNENKQSDKELVRRMFICNICNNTYDKEYEDIHMKSHSTVENYNCKICNRKFYTKENLEMHSKAHKQTNKFSCTYCKKAFSTYESLEEHVSNQCQRRPYECQYCGRRFSRPHEKVKHERIHTGEKPHVCQICGKSFRVSYCLTLHLRTHSGTRPYKCNHCCKRFKSHSVYNHHMLTHSSVRGYKCPYCQKAFKTSVQLAGHKNSHTKPFTCNECNRPFASLYAVRAHMESHKRENNLKYDCWQCGATYARSYALKDHMKSHENAESNQLENKKLTEMETVESITKISNQMEVEDEQQKYKQNVSCNT